MKRLAQGLWWMLAIASALSAAQAARIQWADLPEPARLLASRLGFSSDTFADDVQAIDNRTVERLRDGELDHLVYYMLQSRTFTDAPPVEPAGSAIRYFGSPEPAMPADVTSRIRDFIKALRNPSDERQRYFATLAPQATAAAILTREYDRGMRFLYRKEVECREAGSPQACVAELYQDRGHSSDTSSRSTVAVAAALEWLSKQNRSRIGRVLVIGPGQDFASRSGFADGNGVGVYQPQQVRDALITLSLGVRQTAVDCVDINDRVLRAASSSCRGTANLNIVTQRLEARAYDLVVATNVLLYMNTRELLLAFVNIRSMLAENGVFIHNDGRFETQVFGKAVGLPAVHFGTVTLDAERRPVLTDRYVIHIRGIR